jgi:hypothetical protein
MSDQKQLYYATISHNAPDVIGRGMFLDCLMPVHESRLRSQAEEMMKRWMKVALNKM